MIVITGLDGSGKSTFLQKLEAELPTNSAILRMPSLDSHLFSGDKLLHEMCLLTNALGQVADAKKQPSFKILAMFGAVLIYEDLHQHLLKNGAKQVFGERHPLIDTLVYARAYHKVMHPNLLDENWALELENQFPLAIKGFVMRIKAPVFTEEKSGFKNILATLHTWFSKPENFESHNLNKLFAIEKPEQIYFLDAPTDVLVSRLAEREKLEFHETEAHLAKMRSLYLGILQQCGVPFKMINATGFTEVDALQKEFLARAKGQI